MRLKRFHLRHEKMKCKIITESGLSLHTTTIVMIIVGSYGGYQ